MTPVIHRTSFADTAHWLSMGTSAASVLAFLILAPSSAVLAALAAAVLLVVSTALGVRSSRGVSTAKQVADAVFLNIAVVFLVFAGSGEAHLVFFFVLPMVFSFLVFQDEDEKFLFTLFLLVPAVLLMLLGVASEMHPVLWDTALWSDPNFRIYLIQTAAVLISTAVLLIYRQSTNLLRREMVAKTAVAIEAEKRKSQYLASVAHEIRTPISSILGFSEMLESQESDTTRRQMASLIVSVSTNLLEVVNDLLDGENLERGHMVVRSEPTPLLRVVEAACNTLRLHAYKNNVHFFLNFDCDLPETIVSDAVRLRQVLINLLSNAVKFSQTGRDVPVGICRFRVCKEDDQTILFEVADSGIGMSPEQLSRVFEPFQQAHEGIQKKYGGTGLGLSIVKSIIEEMDGRIEITSAEGEGTVVQVRLPLNPVDSTAPQATPKPHPCVVYFDTPYQGNLVVHYLRARGHPVTVCESEKDLFSQTVPAGATAVLLDLSNRFVRRLAKKVSKKRPDLRVVGISSDPEHMAAVGVDAVVPSSPLIPSNLWAALHGPAGGTPKEFEEEIDFFEVPPRVLVVEDNEIYRLLLTRQFSKLGASVTAVSTIREARDVLKNKPVNFVLTDCNLPDGKGVELLEPIRDCARRTQFEPVVLAMSGSLDPETAARVKEAGIAGYERKPIALDKLEYYFAQVTQRMHQAEDTH